MKVTVRLLCEEKRWEAQHEFDLPTIPQVGWKLYVSDQSDEAIVKEVFLDLFNEDAEIVCELLEPNQFVFVFWNGSFQNSPWHFINHGREENENEFRQALQEMTEAE